jgi:hypothetical protein
MVPKRLGSRPSILEGELMTRDGIIEQEETEGTAIRAMSFLYLNNPSGTGTLPAAPPVLKPTSLSKLCFLCCA